MIQPEDVEDDPCNGCRWRLEDGRCWSFNDDDEDCKCDDHIKERR